MSNVSDHTHSRIVSHFIFRFLKETHRNISLNAFWFYRFTKRYETFLSVCCVLFLNDLSNLIFRFHFKNGNFISNGQNVSKSGQRNCHCMTCMKNMFPQEATEQKQMTKKNCSKFLSLKKIEMATSLLERKKKTHTGK